MIRILLKDQKGSLLLQAMVVVSAIALASFLFSGKVVDIIRVSGKTEKTYKEKNILSSALSYAQYLLVNRFCVDPDTSLAKEDCDPLMDTKSLERLLILPSTALDIQNRFKINVIPLNTLSFEIRKQAITPSHPIYDILQTVKSDKLLIVFKSYRDTSRGKIVNVQITASLKVEGKSDALVGHRMIELRAQSINQYSLMLNRNLVIGEKGIAQGVSSLDYGRKVNVFKDSKNGKMSFHSPVFVNGDFFIPSKSQDEVKGTVFSSLVNIGKDIKQYDQGNSEIFTPSHTSQLATMNKYPSFKGLLGSIKRQKYELALENLFNNQYNGFVRDTKMIGCINYAKRRFDSDSTKNSRLLIRKLNNNGDYLLGLTKLNEFVTINPRDQDYKNPYHNSITYKSPVKAPVISLTARYSGGGSTSKPFGLGFGSEVTINAYKAGWISSRLSYYNNKRNQVIAERDAKLSTINSDREDALSNLEDQIDENSLIKAP